MAAAGLAVSWFVRGTSARLPPGVVILIAGIAISVILRGRSGSLIVLLAAGLVAQRFLFGGQLPELFGSDGVAVGAARWLQAAGLLIAGVGAIRSLTRPVAPASVSASGGGAAGPDSTGSAAQVLGLLLLCAVGAELLAAYDDSTGQVGPLLFAAVFFGALYGAPALLIREIVRRSGWGWPSMILLAFALAILQPGVIDQSMFSTGYRSIDSWEDSRRRTFIEPLGLSAHMAVNFILGHVIYSFCAPIAVAEAWRPRQVMRAWVGFPAMVLSAMAYLGAALLIIMDPESASASPAQLGGSLVTAGACAVGAVLVGRRGASPDVHHGWAPGLTTTLVGTLVLALVSGVMDETWTGVAINIGVTGLIAIAVAHAARRPDWGARHAAAVGLGFLLCRGLLAFTYFPLVGEVSAVRKSSHNAVMLAVVGLAGWLALRRVSRRS